LSLLEGGLDSLFGGGVVVSLVSGSEEGKLEEVDVPLFWLRNLSQSDLLFSRGLRLIYFPWASKSLG